MIKILFLVLLLVFNINPTASFSKDGINVIRELGKDELPWQKYKKGKPVLVYSLTFEVNDTNIDTSPKDKIDIIIEELQSNEEMRIMLHSYASRRVGKANQDRRISLKRAISIREYMAKNGINTSRITVRAFGSKVDKEPWDRVDIFIL